jgi:hypothetical protein
MLAPSRAVVRIGLLFARDNRVKPLPVFSPHLANIEEEETLAASEDQQQLRPRKIKQKFFRTPNIQKVISGRKKTLKKISFLLAS